MPMKSINLIFGCHSHQPVGNFDFVFAEAYEKAYVPFIGVLEQFPAVRVTLHFTGPLWDWFAAYRPEFLKRLAALVRAGQIEIMGGGYYEPMLCAIPERDAIAQIRRMQAFCEEHFGQKPRGMWLTERVWEPQTPRTLARAGVEYTALDDTHFLCSGLRPEQLFGYYMTDDEGLTVKVFPILEKLRYLIPFHQVSETIEYLREHATEDGSRCAVIHDDGEKFGIWPGTHASVYEEGWLEEFFQALTDQQDWLHSLTYSNYLDRSAALGRTYLTCASYQEMMEWVLPTEMQRELHAVKKELEQDPVQRERIGQFIRGGFWRGFLSKYPESNNLQKRMLRVSNRLEALKARRPGDPRLEAAERLLHQGQCNCAYWHGVFGGLYLNHLRTAIYECLIEAERTMNEIEDRAADWVGCEEVDFDADGQPEAVIENRRLSLFFQPGDGGTLFELDYLDKPFNFVNTLSRREEPYHDALRTGQVVVGDEDKGHTSIHDIIKAREANLDTFLVYDPYRRVCLRDHFLPESVSVDELWRSDFQELGDFAEGAYQLATGTNTVTLTRNGAVLTEGASPVRLCKTITLAPDASEFEIRYDIKNVGRTAFTTMFGFEFAVNLLTGASFDRYYRSDERNLRGAKLGERAVDTSLSHIALRDDWQHLEIGLRFSEPARVYRFAIETVSQSEGGQERVYQGSVLVPCWTISAAPGATIVKTVRVEVVNTRSA
jgi:alpha-amylase